jgi:hypothetical protein
MSTVFNIASLGIAEGTIDWENDTTLRLMLLAGVGAPARTCQTVAAVLATADVDELSATGYERKTLGSKAVTQSTDKTLFDSADVEYAALGGASNGTITGWLIYKGTLSSGDDATNIPIAYVEAASDLTTNGSPVAIKPNATDKWFYLNNPGT